MHQNPLLTLLLERTLVYTFHSINCVIVTHIHKLFVYVDSLKVTEEWKNYTLDLVGYQNKCRLIRGWDDLFTRVKERINSLTAMKLSPYFKVHFAYR